MNCRDSFRFARWPICKNYHLCISFFLINNTFFLSICYWSLLGTGCRHRWTFGTAKSSRSYILISNLLQHTAMYRTRLSTAQLKGWIQTRSLSRPPCADASRCAGGARGCRWAPDGATETALEPQYKLRIMPLGHLFFSLSSTSAAHAPFACIVPDSISCSYPPWAGSAIARSCFFCMRRIWATVWGEQAQAVQVSTALEAATSKTETNCSGNSISLQPD